LAAHHWRSLNDGFQDITSRSLEIAVCLLLAESSQPIPIQLRLFLMLSNQVHSVAACPSPALAKFIKLRKISGISPMIVFLSKVAGFLFFGLPAGLPDCPG
jgi:hypothetical protein